jgi:hypothetical protein
MQRGRRSRIAGRVRRGDFRRREGCFGALELNRMLCGEHDAQAAIVEINAGRRWDGGSRDWADMILRMYSTLG